MDYHKSESTFVVFSNNDEVGPRPWKHRMRVCESNFLFLRSCFSRCADVGFYGWRSNDSYLVDPASSHMLVSKIKPCMSKYKHVLYCETADGSLNQL